MATLEITFEAEMRIAAELLRQGDVIPDMESAASVADLLDAVAHAGMVRAGSTWSPALRVARAVAEADVVARAGA